MWAVGFSKQTLLVTDWNETLSFYNLQGQQIFKERHIGNAIIIVLGWFVQVLGIPISLASSNLIYCEAKAH